MHEAWTAAPGAGSQEPELADLRDGSARGQFALELKQNNAVSRKAGNADDLCAGAAVAGALILSADSPEAATANAKALRAVADDREAWNRLPASVERKDVEAALARFEHGVLSKDDAAMLQQLAYAAGRSLDKRPREGGTGPIEVGALAAQLQANGARLEGTRFVEVADAKVNGHWVAVKDKRLLDSAKLGLGFAHLKRESASWDSEVVVSEKKVQVLTRGGGQVPRAPRGRAYEIDVETASLPKNKFQTMRSGSLVSQWEQLAAEAQRRGAVPVR